LSLVPTQTILAEPLGPRPLRSSLPRGHPALVPAPVANATIPSLDTENKSARCLEPPSTWELMLAAKRKRRFYQRAMSGLKLGGNLKLITLTTSEEACSKGLSIQKSFAAFLQRLRRRGWCSGYVKVKEFTRRGLPHVHVIMRGPYIPHSWLSQVWSEIHLSPVVDVRAIKGHHGMGSYLAKYLGKDPRARYSWSQDWVWKAFVADWKSVCREGFERGETMDCIISVWEAILERYRLGRILNGEPGIGVH